MTTLAPPATAAPVRVLPTRKDLVDMLTDAVTARVLIVCASVVTVVLLLVLGFSATHGGDILVVASAVSSVLTAVATALAKFLGNRGNTTGG